MVSTPEVEQLQRRISYHILEEQMASLWALKSNFEWKLCEAGVLREHEGKRGPQLRKVSQRSGVKVSLRSCIGNTWGHCSLLQQLP